MSAQSYPSSLLSWSPNPASQPRSDKLVNEANISAVNIFEDANCSGLENARINNYVNEFLYFTGA